MDPWTPVPRRVTLRDIAERLGLSDATVSRALNAKADAFISEGTRKRVLEAASEMGYRPNQLARSLLTGRTGLVGLWLYAPRGQRSYHDAVTRTMGEAARAGRYQTVVNLISPELEPSLDNLAFDRWSVDGIIAHEVAVALAEGPRPPTPLVATGTYGLLEGSDAVEIELMEGARAAMAHLLAGGRRRVVYVTDGPGRGARHRAFSEAMAAAGLEPHVLRVASSRASAREEVKALAVRDEPPDALFCHNDDLAIGAYRGLCDLGLRVPEDVAIVGCDGIEDLEYLEVPITTIAQPLEAMCEIAFGLLQSRIERPDLPIRRERLSARLVVRASSGG